MKKFNYIRFFKVLFINENVNINDILFLCRFLYKFIKKIIYNIILNNFMYLISKIKGFIKNNLLI